MHESENAFLIDFVLTTQKHERLFNDLGETSSHRDGRELSAAELRRARMVRE